MFLDHTRRRSTVGRTPVDEWSARRREQGSGRRPRLLRSWVRIPPGAWIFVCCECRVLSGRGLCDELITRPEESYQLCCVIVYDLETSRIGAPYIYDISSLRVKFITVIYWQPLHNMHHKCRYNTDVATYAEYIIIIIIIIIIMSILFSFGDDTWQTSVNAYVRKADTDDDASIYIIIPVDNQLGTQFLLWYVYLNPLRVLNNCVLILRRKIVWIQLPV